MKRCFKCSKSLAGHDTKHGLHISCFIEWFNTDEDFKDLTQRNEVPIEIGETPSNSSFFHGKFEKYSAILGNKHYILKNSREYPELSRTEYLCNQLGEALGLEIPSHFLIKLMNQEVFISYNFMQDYMGADLKHIYHFLPSKDEYNVETLVNIIANKTGRLSEIRKFLTLCLFDALIGNDDRHGRNLALIFTSSGCLFSPCYDNPSFIARTIWLGADLNSSGRIETSTSREPDINDYGEELIRLGYKDVLEEFIKNIGIQKLESIVNSSFLSAKRKKAFIIFLNKQYGKLKNVLPN